MRVRSIEEETVLAIISVSRKQYESGKVSVLPLSLLTLLGSALRPSQPSWSVPHALEK